MKFFAYMIIVSVVFFSNHHLGNELSVDLNQNMTEIVEEDLDDEHPTYDMIWHLDYYEEDDVYFTDVSLTMNDTTEFELGIYPGLLNHSLDYVNMLVDKPFVVDGCASFYAGLGTVLTISHEDNWFYVTAIYLEEGEGEASEKVLVKIELLPDAEIIINDANVNDTRDNSDL